VCLSQRADEKESTGTPRYIKNWADSVKIQGFGSHQTFDFGGQLTAPKCPTFHIPEPLLKVTQYLLHPHQ